ncbi:MAG: stage III sporulation protein AG [Acetatifactor sp.]
MEKYLNKWLDKEKLKKIMRKDNMLILILAGILLFVVVLPVNKEKNGEQTGTMKEFGGELQSYSPSMQEGSSVQGQAGAESMGNIDLDYASDLEKKLTEVLSGMAGVGRVNVMITLKSSAELVVEKENPINKSSTTETDAQGGNRSVSTEEYGETVIYSTSGNESVPYVVMTYVPRIEGVLVVAEGAGNGTVNRTITDAVSALFGVDAHKIKVVKMEVQSN